MKKIALWWSFVLLAFIVPVLALAQTAALNPDDPGALAGALLAAFAGKQWSIAAGVALMLIVFAVRKYVLKSWSWAQTDRGGVVVALVINVLTIGALQLAAGETSVGAILLAILNSFLGSAGAYTVVKKTTQPSDAPPVATGT